jgi:two-component system, LuxR family, sensor kinase FixL
VNLITVLWSAAAGAALTLGLVQGLVWLFDRRALASLTFAIVAVAVTCLAPIEVRMLHALTPEEYGAWLRWLHLPMFFAIAGTVVFVRLYLGTGRTWLAVTIIALRGLVLLGNFVLHPNITFKKINTLVQVPFLGEQVSTVGHAVLGDWQWVASFSLIAWAVFVVDAVVTLWRRGDHEGRRKALVVGGGILAFLVLSSIQGQMVVFGVTRAPVLVSLPFLVTLLAMAFELSHDVIHSARLHRELRDSEQRLSLAANAAGLGLWEWDIGANAVKATDKARVLHGISETKAVGFDRWSGAIHPDDQATVRQELERAQGSGEGFGVEYRIRLPDGTVRWILARGRSDRHRSGPPVLMRGVIRDITERKQAQSETEELRRELAHAGRVTLLGQLASSLAHELNQPLGAILRNAEAAEMLLKAATPDLDEIRAIVADILRDDRRAGKVIDRLRALLKRRSVDFQPLSLDGLIQDVISLVRPDAAARHVALHYLPISELPPAVGDRVQLSQVLLNLIVNGMDAVMESPEGRRRIVIETRALETGMVEVLVSDSGPGVAPTVIDRLFEPFFTTKSQGMGMGLPVSRTIIEAHGGRLNAENREHGATFRFTLVAARDAKP